MPRWPIPRYLRELTQYAHAQAGIAVPHPRDTGGRFGHRAGGGPHRLERMPANR